MVTFHPAPTPGRQDIVHQTPVALGFGNGRPSSLINVAPLAIVNPTTAMWVQSEQAKSGVLVRCRTLKNFPFGRVAPAL